MKKIATITFHACYNFGSCLQAYALQSFVTEIAKKENIDVDYKILNFRTDLQKDLYNFRKNSKGIKKLLKVSLYNKKLKGKEKKFESFINNYLNLTEREYKSFEELDKENIDYDYYISGSDQIWNTTAKDFDWAFYLGFVKKGKKISYAASLGPKKVNLTEENKSKICKLLSQYDSISVREKKSCDKVNEIAGIIPQINVDPTLLINKSQWEEMISNQNNNLTNYIFFYSLNVSNEMVELLKKISKILNKRVVVAACFAKYDIMGGFVKKYNSGPLEFLSLIKNADLVISSSFHGTVFSIIFNKPFYAFDGKNDFRISNLLEKTELMDRSISFDDDLNQKLKNAFNINFEKANMVIENEQKRSEKYLKEALEIG